MPHIHEKIDFTSEVFIVFESKVLLRFHEKYKIWLSVGGHVELDEDPVQAALREVKEEVGMDVQLVETSKTPVFSESNFKSILAPAYMNRHRVSPTHEHVTCVYFARATSNKTVVAPHEQAPLRWFSLAELDTVELKENVRFYAQEALRVVK
ncbi:MAG TPA: NUDIX domain-containing protein [Acidobacteriota bacterium]|nr:NUDIX domain-containing protein [Acidobacteriota bacterium]